MANTAMMEVDAKIRETEERIEAGRIVIEQARRQYFNLKAKLKEDLKNIINKN